MDTRYIVALEIGSSKIKGIAAAVGELGDINVIAVEETRVSDCVRYGKIQNVQEVSAHVNDIIRKLENNPMIAPRKITEIFVAIGGRSLTTITAQAQAKFPNAVQITAETIDRLKRDASFGLVTDKCNLAMLPHAFFIDNSEVKNVVGTVGSHIRAEFSAIVISPAIRRNLELIKFDNPAIKSNYIVRPTAIADLVLTPSEKQLGCALVDLGAETTTIAIYKDAALQTIVTLPIGSRNLTRDLMNGLSMTEESAETAKIRSGSATTTESTISSDIEICNYISARSGEIVANILHHIDAAGFKNQALPAGIILTGGGSRLRNFDKLIEAQAKMPVRMAAIDSSLQFKGNHFDKNANIELLAIVKQAAAAYTSNCLSQLPEKQEENIVTQTVTQPTVNIHPNPRVVDDENLMEDDPDDIPTTEGRTIRVTGRNKHKHSDVDETQDFDVLEDSDSEHKSTGFFKRMCNTMSSKLSDIWMSAQEDEPDDLDEPTN